MTTTYEIIRSQRTGHWNVVKYELDHEFGGKRLDESFDVEERMVEILREERKKHETLAVGSSIIECLAAFVAAKWPGEPASPPRDLVLNDGVFAWGCRFTIGGTACKAAGQQVPGGYTLTWWK